MSTPPDRSLTGLLVDYGGVLTNPLADTYLDFCAGEDIDPGEFRGLIRELARASDDPGSANLVHALERGELSPADFEHRLAGRLLTRAGLPVPADGLLDRMFSAFRVEAAMVAAVGELHRTGIRTALVSNSWTLDYPRDGWSELFDAVVISGEVGMRKPEPDIYQHAAAELGLDPAACGFVDDLAENVRGAVAVGMVGVLHRAVPATVSELQALFGRPYERP